MERPNRHLARITLGGGDLATFESIGPDQFVYVFVPRPGESDPRVEHDFSWDTWREAPAEDRQVGRYYTVRRHNTEAAELVVDFVLHGDGPLTTWATRAKPGDRVAIWGPRKGFAPPAEARQFLLAGDETGLPAIGAILESLPAGASARVIIEIPDHDAIQVIESKATVQITWLSREGCPAGETSLLIDAIQAAGPPAGPFYAWGGGEFRAMNAFRKYLRGELGMGVAEMSVIAYWRHRDHTEEEDA